MIAGNQNPTAQARTQQSLGRWSNEFESNNMQHRRKQKECSIAFVVQTFLIASKLHAT